MTFAIWHRGFQSRAAMLQTLASLLRSVDSTLVARATGLGGREGETETLDEKRGDREEGLRPQRKKQTPFISPLTSESMTIFFEGYGNL